MQKTLIVLAMLAASTAYSQNVTSANGNVATSAVSIGVNSFHTASGTATNLSTASGAGMPGLFSATAVSNAASGGSTLTSASGVGFGMSGATADQSGAAFSNQVGLKVIPLQGVNATSGAMVDTGSSANVLNSGLAVSGSNGQAHNGTVANISTHLFPPSTSATGTSSGSATVGTFGFATPGFGDFVNAGGVANSGGTWKTMP